jgi:hypothetical protein
MPERTAAEVLAEKLKAAFVEMTCLTLTAQNIELVAARLAEDPAITVRTDMVVERFVVEFHCTPAPGLPDQHDPKDRGAHPHDVRLVCRGRRPSHHRPPLPGGGEVMPKRAAAALLLLVLLFWGTSAGFGDNPPHQITPHIVCWQVGGGFCWVPWVW